MHKYFFPSLSVLLFCQAAPAMQPMSESEMSVVTGKDGLTLTLDVAQLGADQIRWSVDAGNYLDGSGNITTTVTPNPLAGELVLDNISVDAVNTNGVVQPGSAYFTTELDSSATEIGLAMSLDRVRLKADAIRLGDSTVKSFGTVALDASAQIQFANQGILNNGSDTLRLYGEINDGALFYRQQPGTNASYLLLSDLNALWRVIDGRLGIGANENIDPYYTNVPLATQTGLRTSAPFLDVRLDFNLLYKNPNGLGESEFLISGNELGAMHFGWQGTVVDAELIYKAGGLAYNGVRSQGLNFSSRWNYMRDDGSSSANPGVALSGVPATAEPFRWRFGEVSGPAATSGFGVRFELSDWRNMPGVTYGHFFPYIGMDVINAGQGSAPLCWGGSQSGPCNQAGQESVSLAAGTINSYVTPTTTADGLAISVRDGNLLTYAEKVRFFDNSDPSLPFSASNGYNREFDWGLIYTLANIDGDIYFYPGGTPGDTDNGVIADILLMSQTLDGDAQGDNWSRGSHLLIADTNPAVNMAIGLMNVSFMLKADDTRIWIKDTDAATTGSMTAEQAYQGGLDLLSREARLDLRGTFGGRDLAAGGRVLEGTIVGLNYEGLMNLRISPAPQGQNYLGFSGALRATSGTYFSLAEPSRRDVEARFGNITGDLAFTNGKIDLRGAAEDGDGFPKLRISTDMLIGQTAATRMLDAVQGTTLPGGAAGQPLIIGAVTFAGNSLGSIVVPSGQLHSSLTLRPQTPSF